MWSMVCCWPQSQESGWARPHLCKLAWPVSWPWPVWKRFIRDYVWWGRWKPGCWIVRSVTTVWLTTEADDQPSLHCSFKLTNRLTGVLAMTKVAVLAQMFWVGRVNWHQQMMTGRWSQSRPWRTRKRRSCLQLEMICGLAVMLVSPYHDQQMPATHTHTHHIHHAYLSFWQDVISDASQAIFEPPSENWRRPPGRPHTTWMKNVHDDLSSLDLGIHEATDLAQNQPLWLCTRSDACYCTVLHIGL